MSKWRFVIVDDCDAPVPVNVAQLTRIGYCYMTRYGGRSNLKHFDGMTKRKATTPIEDFGFTVTEHGSRGLIHFRRSGPSIAKYPDGLPRDWQSTEEDFILPIVRDARRKKARK